MGRCTETGWQCPLQLVVLLLTHLSSFAFSTRKRLFHCFYLSQPSKRRLVPVPLEIDQTCPSQLLSPGSFCPIFPSQLKEKTKANHQCPF
ncbi:LOW QUALITY PROTEIN: hypothetical protein BT93_D0948 [Corymbia citriodora subsp. variegata]|nr:LOW QUALITY PROTEIN: hypothetical protein BT93_D0948 [Corymbia citriodora subsp. variegata]